VVGASEVTDEPCRCIEDGLQSPHQINWDTDENTNTNVLNFFRHGVLLLLVLSKTEFVVEL